MSRILVAIAAAVAACVVQACAKSDGSPAPAIFSPSPVVNTSPPPSAPAPTPTPAPTPAPAPAPTPSPTVPPATGTRLHDTLHASETITFGTHGTGTAQNFQAPFDDFTPAASVAVRALEWQGYYCNRGFVGSDVPGAVATQFIIRIAPHNPVTDLPAYSAFPASATSETEVIIVPASAVRQQLESTRLDSPCGSRNGGDPAALYKFTTHFASPIQVTAGRRYWISITATVPDSPPVSWHWRFGRRDNGTSRFCLCSQSGTTVTTFHDDRAFSLWY